MTNDAFWTKTALNHFANFDPSNEEIEHISNAVQQLVAKSGEITAIQVPLRLKEFGTVYAALTADKKWQILFNFEPSGNLMILHVSRV